MHTHILLVLHSGYRIHDYNKPHKPYNGPTSISCSSLTLSLFSLSTLHPRSATCDIDASHRARHRSDRWFGSAKGGTLKPQLKTRKRDTCVMTALGDARARLGFPSNNEACHRPSTVQYSMSQSAQHSANIMIPNLERATGRQQGC